MVVITTEQMIEFWLDQIRRRKLELAPVAGEAACLADHLATIERAIQERDELAERLAKIKPQLSKNNVRVWVLALDMDETFKVRDVCDAFAVNYQAAARQLKYLVGEGILEKWGKGQYRRRPDRRGEARLSVVTRGRTAA